MGNLFHNKHQADILGTNSCFDRIVITGSLVPIAYLKGLNTFLSANKILLKRFLVYAKDLAERLKVHAKLLAEKSIHLFE